VKAEWEPDELIETWTLTGDDWGLVGNKSGATRLGFSVMLKFYEIEGRLPAYREEVPTAAVRYLASLVKIDPALFAKYPWRGRSIEYHRAQVRRVYGTRGATEDDEERSGGVPQPTPSQHRCPFRRRRYLAVMLIVVFRCQYGLRIHQA
jgi:hypothetical protein